MNSAVTKILVTAAIEVFMR